MGDSSGSDDTFLDSEFRYKVFPIFYGIVFVLGLVANVYALFILHHMRGTKAMNEICIYMTNLTVADLLFVCALPFWISYYNHRGNWIFGEVMCQITGAMFFINIYCSVLFLMVISVNRYWAVTRPLLAASTNCWRRGAIVSFLIWAFIIGGVSQQLAETQLRNDHINGSNISRCYEGYHNATEKAKNSVANSHFLLIGLFLFVFLLVVVCNVLIACTLLAKPHRQASTGRRPRGTKRQAVRMLCVVVGVFVICLLPHHVIQGPWTLAVLGLRDSWGHGTKQMLNDAHQVTLLLMSLNCIMDPVVYCFATRRFRSYLQDHFKRFRSWKACPSQITAATLHMRSRHQSEA